MRKFIFGVLLGGLAVYFWQQQKTSCQKPSEEAGHADLCPEAPQTTTAVSEPSPVSFLDALAECGSGGTGLPSYQTAPLVDYQQEYQRIAEQLFNKASALVGQNRSVKRKGSYSFLERGGSTGAKIVIYQQHLGKGNGSFPSLTDGVYVWLRTYESEQNTIGVVPKDEGRFTYFKLDSGDIDGAAQSIATHLQQLQSRTQSAGQ